MRAFKRFSHRGFTLVELMIVVAIIGVLAALAIYGVRRYLASAKTAEAKNSLGAMARGAVGSYERESGDATIITPGNSTAGFVHDICAGASQPVPANITNIQGKKYTPSQAPGSDFELGSESEGWKCLKFNLSSPTYYQYGYNSTTRGGVTSGQTPAATGSGALTSYAGTGFLAWANGDLDGDTQLSAFSQKGDIDTAASIQQLYLAPELEVKDEFE